MVGRMTRARFARGLFRAFVLVTMALLLVEGALHGVALVIHLAGRRADAGWSTDGLRVLALGDSNTYGIYLDEEESYPSQLEALWNQDPGPSGPIEVLNFGYPGNSSGAILADYERSLAVLEPDVVLFLAGANDYWALPAVRAATGADTSSPLDFLARNSRLYRLWRIARGAGASGESDPAGAPDFRDPAVRLEIEQRGINDWLRERGEGEAAVVAETRRHGGESFAFGFRAVDSPAPRDQTEQRLAANLAELHEISEAARVPLILMTYPSDAGLYRLANGLIRSTARARGWDVVDLAAVFTARCAGDPKCPRYLLPDGHPTALGYAVVAERVREELRKRTTSESSRSSR